MNVFCFIVCLVILSISILNIVVSSRKERRALKIMAEVEAEAKKQKEEIKRSQEAALKELEEPDGR